MQTVMISITEDILDRAEAHARLYGISLSTLVCHALQPDEAVDGDPAASNLDGLEFELREETVRMSRETVVRVPPESVQVYVVPRR